MPDGGSKSPGRPPIRTFLFYLTLRFVCPDCGTDLSHDACAMLPEHLSVDVWFVASTPLPVVFAVRGPELNWN